MTMRRVLYQPTGTEHLAELPTRTYCGRRLTGPWLTWDEERRVSWRTSRRVCQKCLGMAEPSVKALEEMPEVDMTGARRGHYAEAPGWTGKLGWNEPGAERHSQRHPGSA